MDRLVMVRLGYALTGVELDLHVACQDGRNADLLSALAGAGWGSAEIRAHATERRAIQQPWPHAVPVEWLREHGPARWAAALLQAVSELGLDVSAAARPHARPLNADERRLLAEVPPHHGS